MYEQRLQVDEWWTCTKEPSEETFRGHVLREPCLGGSNDLVCADLVFLKMFVFVIFVLMICSDRV